MKRYAVLLSSLIWIALGGGSPWLTPACACTMPQPTPAPEEPEHELWVESLGTDPTSGKLRFLVGAEVDLFPISQPADCQCALILGNRSFVVPPSTQVSKAMVATVNRASHASRELPEFEGFEEEIELENEIEDSFGIDPEAEVSAFMVQVNPFEPQELDPEDVYKLWFVVEVAPEDAPALQGAPVRIGAGSDLPGHEFQLFEGYQDVLVLPLGTTPTPTPTPPGGAPTATPTPSPTPAPPCAGDCDGDGRVTVDELLQGVRLALGLDPLSACAAMDGDGDGTVSIAELIAGVRSALEGCP